MMHNLSQIGCELQTLSQLCCLGAKSIQALRTFYDSADEGLCKLDSYDDQSQKDTATENSRHKFQ